MKKVILSLTSVLLLIISSSCSKSSSDIVDPTTSLPVMIDFHQIVGNRTINGDINYVQDGLTVQTLDNSSYHVEAVNELWLYPGRLKISNINTLNKLKKITIKWDDNNSSAIATLYDSADTVIETQTKRGKGEYSFMNVEKASYLILRGGETLFGPIKFE